jgi:hypothetical protein
VVGSMITKTFFLAKVIHRILIRSLRGKKSLHENLAKYRIFLALRAVCRAARRAVCIIYPEHRAQSWWLQPPAAGSRRPSQELPSFICVATASAVLIGIA